MRSFVRELIHMQLPVWFVAPLLPLFLFIGIGTSVAYSAVVQAFTPATSCPEELAVCEQFEVFWQVWDIASEDFVDPEAIQPDLMIEGSINGMLDTLGDQGHTRFLSAETARQWDQSLSGEYEGIGAYLDMLDGQAIISEPIEGSPAEEAGVMAGDYIIKVDGQDTKDWTIDEVARNIRGPKGTTVQLTLRRPGQEALINVSIERNTVELPSVRWTMLPDNIALVRLTTFARRSADEMQEALTEAQDEGAQMLILDLRNNMGGLVNEAIGISSQFLPEGTVVLVEEDREGNRTTTSAKDGGVALDIPMVALVNRNTASSAEILSGALQDHGRARLVGVQTVGTGTVLTPYTLEGGAKLLLGTVQWLTPDGRLIRNQGITPDVEIILPMGVEILSPPDAAQLSEDELLESEDEQLLEAIETLHEMTTQP